MTKLTDTQLIILSNAAAREDRCGVLPGGKKAAAALKAGAGLIDGKLMREVRAKPNMPVWRRDGENRAFSLVLTAVGQKAIRVDDGQDDNIASSGPASAGSASAGSALADTAPHEASPSETGAADHSVSSDALASSAPPRPGSKQALVIAMLSADTGTTIDALAQATGWLPHTTRAALTGLRKRGLAIERSRMDEKGSVYRIVASASQAVA